MRSAEKPDVVGSSEAIRIAEIAASLTSSSPPRNSSAAVIARITSSAICNGPLPIRNSRTLATAMPSTTPPISSTRAAAPRPWVAPRQTTAAIDANAGRSVGSSSIASHHAASAAAAVWRIARMCGRTRRRSVVAQERGESWAVESSVTWERGGAEFGPHSYLRRG